MAHAILRNRLIIKGFGSGARLWSRSRVWGKKLNCGVERGPLRSDFMKNDGDGANDGLSRKEIEIILRGMRSVFAEAGRTSLAKLLAGSRAKTVREEWKKNPSYGGFLEKSHREILGMIDWCLEMGLIELERRDGYPLLVYGERGLAIDMELAAREFLEEMREKGFFWTKEELVQQIPHRTLTRVLELMKEEGVENWRGVLETWHERGSRRMKGWIEAATDW